MSKDEDKKYMDRAIELAEYGMQNGHGGPFGAVIVRDGKIIGEGYNQVLSSNDPTAHAEVVAIRDACEKEKSFQLDGAVLYTSCEPCPMCLGAIYWARPERIVMACEKEDAAAVGFDDAFIYKEINTDYERRSIPVSRLYREKALILFNKWDEKQDKTHY